jgi:flagellar basal-body rod protein FlgC
MPDNTLLRSLDIAASAMSAERLRMTVASENLANAGDTSAPGQGLPYARQRVLFTHVMDQHGKQTGEIAAQSVDSPRYTQRHDPSHPHADPATGMVTMSDIDPILELTDLLVASRAYDANANAARGLIRLAESALRMNEA